MKVLLIGAGLIGQERLLALEKISMDYSMDFETTVVDPDENLLEESKKRFNVNINTDYIDELAKSPEWVFISTPHSVAPEIVMNCFKSAKNILVENWACYSRWCFIIHINRYILLATSGWFID